jgi:hypothetical protein
MLLGWAEDVQGSSRALLSTIARSAVHSAHLATEKLNKPTCESIQKIHKRLYSDSTLHRGSSLPTRQIITDAIQSEFPNCSVTFDSAVPESMAAGYPRAPWHHESRARRTGDVTVPDREYHDAGEYTWARGKGKDEVTICRVVLKDVGPALIWDIPFTGDAADISEDPFADPPAE